MKKPIKLKITLKDLPHKCYRKLLVPEEINMRQLHFVIQESFGWLNAHLFEFSDAKAQQSISVGMPDDFEMEWIGPEKQIAHKVQLKEAFLEGLEGKDFWYNYDFGDDWWHQISFLKTTKKEIEDFQGIPVCLEAEGKCPPEDVGGPYGYAEFLKTIRNKKHPEYKETRSWYGLEKNEEFNENLVNLKDINYRLQDFYHSEEWKDDSYELF
ncbi:pRiA4b ORF-3-like protein [Salegentibacter sp. 24]|uniref:plasmid pRiA4b ORF-3 family protein n=1 Tax=Salegentibacter sp. 24 TaxID=2183986 RepID=UPI00105D62F1|nr:plasmid pRiA4b ORF-3 family protein [Salegentibacter sp. 24]TDN95026.1 pRiA4b ORF-3-like protein [Salegentibacter sp. 24]